MELDRDLVPRMSLILTMLLPLILYHRALQHSTRSRLGTQLFIHSVVHPMTTLRAVYLMGRGSEHEQQIGSIWRWRTAAE